MGVRAGNLHGYREKVVLGPEACVGEGLTRWGCYGNRGTEIQGIFWIRMNAFMGWSSESH